MLTVCKAIGLFGINCETQKESISEVEQRFVQHITSYGLSFATEEEYTFRFAIFTKHDQEINEINARPDLTFSVGHNIFSTMTQDEKQARMGKRQTISSIPTIKEEVSDDVHPLGDGIDWR